MAYVFHDINKLNTIRFMEDWFQPQSAMSPLMADNSENYFQFF